MDIMELTDSFHNFVNMPKESLLTIIDIHQYMRVSPTVLTFLLSASLEFMTQFNTLTKPLTHLCQLQTVEMNEFPQPFPLAHHFSHSLQSSSG
jgi:hypothetical protein